MNLHLESIPIEGYEKVVYAEEASSGLKSIIAIHNTALGSACGGIRLYPYKSKEAALMDVLRLAKGMSYKSALAGIEFGGGKSVIIAEPEKKNRALLHAFAKFVNTFAGKYISAKDMNISNADLLTIKEVSPYVVGIEGVKGSSGNPSGMTARGVFRAMEATAEFLFDSRSLRNLRIAIQGVGDVGFSLATLLYEAGASLFLTDLNEDILMKAKNLFQAKIVKPEEIFEVTCDIFSPCAMGGILNKDTIPKLQCRAIVGAANNQLQEEDDVYRLKNRDVLYMPDFLANAGGIINIFVETEEYTKEKAEKRVDRIYDTAKEVYQRSLELRQPPYFIADQIAEDRMRKGKR